MHGADQGLCDVGLAGGVQQVVEEANLRWEQLQQRAKGEGLLKKDKKADRGKSKEELREEEENVIRSVIADKMDIKGGYAKPNWSDVLWVQLVILPYTIYKWTAFYTRWLWKFGIKREDYGEEEKRYLIRLDSVDLDFNSY